MIKFKKFVTYDTIDQIAQVNKWSKMVSVNLMGEAVVEVLPKQELATARSVVSLDVLIY